jgi:hypothetical protein
MDVASAPWYASGAFWTPAGTVAGLLIGAVGVWVTFTVGSLRRRLYYGMRAAAPLLSAPDGMRSKLELRYDGAALAEPQVLTVQLLSRGRKDIPSDAFNDGKPLRLDVGAPIVEILQISSYPETLSAPSVTASGTALEIGPSLIGRRHEIIITVLTDGGTPSLNCRSPLIDVQVRKRDDEVATVAATALGMAAGVAAASVANLVVGRRSGD